MPYIKEEQRRKLYNENNIDIDNLNEPGQLNYAITKLLLSYLGKKEINYKSLNEIIGVLESVKQEFYRRIVSVYEDEKIQENGEIRSINHERNRIFSRANKCKL